jgi:hypothetical protein
LSINAIRKGEERMKNTFLKSELLAIAGVGLLVGSALATSVDFNLAGYPDSSVNLTQTAGNATLSAAVVSTLGDEIFSLDVGEFYKFDFFTVTISGGLLEDAEATIEATLAFDVPDIIAVGSGDVNAWTFYGIFSGGSLQWDDATVPDLFHVGSSMIQVDFEDGAAFGWGDTATIQATVRNLGDCPAPVPEPATMLLFGTGLAGLAGLRRKKAVKK